MYVSNTHLKPVLGIDIHFVNLPFPFIPLPHPYIGLVIDPFDYIPFIGATVKVNNVPRGNTDTMGMIITFVHIPFGAGFTLFPMIGHDSQNFFGSKKVLVDGVPMSGAGYVLMTCNDIGLPLSFRPGRKFIPIPSLYLPTSFCIPLQWGKPVMVGGPLVPNFSLMALLKAFAMGSAFKVLGKLGGKALKTLNKKVLSKSPSTAKMSSKLCKMGFEPVDLITGRVNYEYTDFELPGPIPINFLRNWDSDSKIQGSLGNKNQLSYDRRIHILSAQNGLALTLADGRAAAFPLLQAGQSFYHPQEKLTLHRSGDGGFLLEAHEESLDYHFSHFISDEEYALSSIEGYSGFNVQFHYNGRYLSGITDSVGRELRFSLNQKGFITRVDVEHRGQKQMLVAYGYDEQYNLNEVTDALGQSTRMVFDGADLMVKKTDRNGQSFYWEYDGKNRCVHTWGDGRLLEGWIAYGKGYNSVTNSLGETTLYWYDENNLCVQETDPYGNNRYTEYTDEFDIYRQIDEEGHVTGFVYDGQARLQEKILPDGNSIRFQYNKNHQQTLIAYPDGSSQTYGYDKQKRLAFINYPNGQTTAYRYNDAGEVSAIVQNNRQKTILGYDEDKNLVSVHLPNGGESRWQYDAFGRCTEAINPEGQVRHYAYDALNRVRHLKLPDGNNINLDYNAYEEVTEATDLYNEVHFEYTPLGSLKKRVQKQHSVEFKYDTEERLRTIVNEAGKNYSFGYNNRGEIISEKGFDGLQRYYERDVAGKVIKTQRPGGRHTLYEYDANGRIIRAEYNDGSWEVFSYDKNGRLSRAENEHSVVQMRRDQMGNVISERQGDYEITSEFDKTGNRIKLSSSLGADVSFERNELGQVTGYKALQKRGDEKGPAWQAQMKYNEAGQEIERLLPGGLSNRWSYDQAGRPQEQRLERNGVLQSWKKYAWNANDRLTEIFDALGKTSTRFGHDETGNLVFAQYADNKVVHRAADETGNLYETPGKTDRKYNAAGALLESDKYIYKYDEEGNLISKTDKLTQKKTAYHWQGNGMLAKVIKPDAKEVAFKYDALGRRIEKTFTSTSGGSREGIVTRFIWDGNVPLHEFIYKEQERPIAMVNEWGEINHNREENTGDLTTWLFDADSFVPTAKLKDGKTYSIISDYLGTPQAMYDDTGNKTWEVVLDIYGRATTLKGSREECPFRYQGQYEDEETGLYYNRFRYYSPEEGDYISQDPIGLAGNNPTLYGYVKDVNKWIDTFGNNIFNPIPWTAPSSGTGINYNTYQQNIDWDLPVNTRSGTMTNLELAEMGKTPFVVKNGQYSQINLHHSQQNANGPLFELSKTTHERFRYTNALHPHLPGAHPHYPVDRDAFNIDREQYWRDRASNERTRRANIAKTMNGCK